MQRELNQPLGGNDMPRFGGIATMMRLPQANSTEGLDACFVGVPLDIGTSNRSGARFGPRQIRSESVLLRPYNMATRAAPFDSLQVADIGDVATNPYDLKDSIRLIESAYDAIVANGCRPITLGGDHTIAWPILRALHKKYGKVAVVHVDAHADVNDTMFGEKIAHGTPFRRAVEDGLLQCDKVTQIGLRGTGYHADDFDWCREQGFTVVQAEACWNRSLAPLMEEVRARVGDAPVYLSFDIDGLDPAFAPGTGTPEVGGLTVQQGLEIVRGMKGLNVVGADLVEVSPPYDQAGTTALVGANLAFEMLCVMPGVTYRQSTRG
ncbi:MULTISPECIES: agmatinase [Caballeronia]|jgi:guanidinobutyrase|uniref:Agmatinase n=2 Tax=Caballeronia TaxID=1827195 RepID=A0AA37MI79_9BURK|nr:MULTISPECIES: agmatinase [Caballeronia]KAK45283.1 agmatinase [Caballeronia jiangsuensis]MBC8635216.1 agmatinase [Caballeronia sp. EK]MDR5748627.1 agmatinase [Caballeronia sp. LZ029]GJH27373.1 agmatinase [Caballeronia novacaledonica]